MHTVHHTHTNVRLRSTITEKHQEQAEEECITQISANTAKKGETLRLNSRDGRSGLWSAKEPQPFQSLSYLYAVICSIAAELTDRLHKCNEALWIWKFIRPRQNLLTALDCCFFFFSFLVLFNEFVKKVTTLNFLNLCMCIWPLQTLFQDK